ncbi:uncharacterized protein LOC131176303 [Hevea brasiliensis]|uniref:uncharacterized protein LOC131176303 n=1 Tax=Hevea brasiliensis TaxID=3981 RepID=UPI0025DEFA5D|nr:uncharacterized protein LOC131176303 [Hevea brasiliensis]
MDEALWSFLQSSPETSVPFPWERCFDQTQLLFYRNILNGSMVVDLRSQVNLGGGLFHLSSIWHDLTGRSYDHRPLLVANQYEQGPGFLIGATCCGPLAYLLVPEMVHCCPLCDSYVFYFG